MLQILIAFLVFYLAFILWKHISTLKAKFERKPSQNLMNDGEMIPCSKCQTYVLKLEAFEKNGKYYCSERCLS